MENELEKRYGLVTATCMVVGIVIGSGVFFKAQTVLQATDGNMPLGILAWLIGGAIMLVCSLAFATMATKYEKVNGVVDYAENTVGKKYAYLVGWFLSTIYYPNLTAVLAWLSARYTLVFCQSVNPDLVLSEGGAETGAECMVLALLYLCGSYGLNALSPKIAGRFQVSTTVIKLIPLGLMAAAGILYGISTGQIAENFTTEAQINTEAETVQVNPLFDSVVATAFAYEGWIVATSINAELKNAKRNLPIALILGAVIVISVYVLYYIGVAGGATNQQLIEEGATVAFLNIFGDVFGNVLNLFVAISCVGTLNGLMLACTRGMYSIAVRGEGPKADVFRQVDPVTKMAYNSSVFGLLACAVWFTFYYGANLAQERWFGAFSFDSSELPIVTIYALYIPIFIMFIKKGKEYSAIKRILVPVLAVAGSIFMIVAAVFAHGVRPFLTAQAEGRFALPILFYLLAFAVIMVTGAAVNRRKKRK